MQFLRWEDQTGNSLGTSRTLSLRLDSADAGLDLSREVTAIFEDTSNPEEQLYSLEVVSEPFGSGTVLGGGAHKLGAVVTLTAVPSNGTDLQVGLVMHPAPMKRPQSRSMDTKGTSLLWRFIEDSDEDGLSDLYEKSLGSDPEDKDTDDDGLDDGEEMNYPQVPYL